MTEPWRHELEQPTTLADALKPPDAEARRPLVSGRGLAEAACEKTDMDRTRLAAAIAPKGSHRFQ
ncbi:MAG: hypothetical protein ACYCVN_04805 [Acidimicrobiales bacterium]